MNQITENIFFTKGISQIPPARKEAFNKDIKKALGVKSRVSVFRRATGKFGTSAKEQARLDKLFRKYDVTNWRGKARKKAKSEVAI